MKSLAVIAVATGVVRVELVTMRQDRGEQFRTFSARVRGGKQKLAIIKLNIGVQMM